MNVIHPRFMNFSAKLAALMMISFTAGCSEQINYRYKLTLKVEADGIIHTAVNVVEVQNWYENDGLLTYASWASDVKGEGSYVDLGKGRILVALLTNNKNNQSATPSHPNWQGSSPAPVLFRAYGLAMRGSRDQTRVGLLELANKRGPIHIGIASLPQLVTFSNLLDPNTVRGLDPNNLNASFHSNVFLKEATIEITQEPITRSLSKKLPWLDGSIRHLSGNHSGIEDTGRLADRLMNSDFKQDGSGLHLRL